jgi:hypothetical protein
MTTMRTRRTAVSKHASIVITTKESHVVATAFRAGLLLAAVMALAIGQAFGQEQRVWSDIGRPYLPRVDEVRATDSPVVYNSHVRRAAVLQAPDSGATPSDSSDSVDLLLDESDSSATPMDRSTAPSPAEAEDEAPETMELPSPDVDVNELPPEGIRLGTPTGNWDEVPPGGDLPAMVCSSRNLLQPGCIYAEADLIYMTRVGRRQERILAFDQTPGGSNVLVTDRGLGWSPGTKLTLGKFLGRDAKNRDYNVEFTYFGLFDWTDEKAVNTIAAGSAFIFTNLDPTFTVQGFNNAAAQQYNYKSQFDSFEANLRVSRRLPRDRMELQPDGRWIRRCDPDLLPSFIVGPRIVQVDERFGYFSQGLNPATRNGTYIVNTSNELYGMQAGVELMYQQCKWRVGGRFKNGIYVNFAEQDSFVHIVDTVNTTADPADRREHATDDVVSWMGELNLEAAYNITPYCALRAGYELAMINETARAIDQLTFSPETPANISTGGFLFYQGVSLGLEMYW